MDCRKWIVLFCGVSLTCAGCMTEQQARVPAEAHPTNFRPPISRPAPTPTTKRKPKAITEMTFAKFQEGEANSDKYAPAQREKLLDRARIAYQRALELDAEHLEARLGLARVYVSLKNHKRALEEYKTVVHKHPNESEAWYQFGVYHGRQKNYTSAVACLRKAAQLDPENRACVKTLGIYLAATGQIEESLQWLTPMFGKAKAHFNLAITLNRFQQPEQARAQMQLAFREAPSLSRTQLGQQLIARLQPGASPVNRTNAPIANISFQPQ